MQTSTFRHSVSLLFLIGLGGLGCGHSARSHSADASSDSASPSAGGEGPGAGGEPSGGGGTAGPVLSGVQAPEAAGGEPASLEKTGDSDAVGGAGNNAAAGAPSDRVRPSIVSLTPANGAIGVKADAPIVIEFSEPMDRRATLDAYASGTLPSAEAGMTWNDAGTILTIQPERPLDYARATLNHDGSLELTPKQYDYTLTQRATDLAGNALEETRVTFSTLREVRQTLEPVGELTGVLASADAVPRLYACLSLDADQLPAGIVALEHAVVRTDPYFLSAPLPIYHVRFDQLTPAAAGAPGQLLTTLPQGTTGDLVIPEALAARVASDYTQRSALYHYSQYRLELPEGTSEANVLAVNKFLADASVEVDYLLP